MKSIYSLAIFLFFSTTSCQYDEKNEIVTPTLTLENQEIESRTDCSCSVIPNGVVKWADDTILAFLNFWGDDCFLDECNDCWGQTSQTNWDCVIGDNYPFDRILFVMNTIEARELLCIIEDYIEDNRPSSQYKVKDVLYLKQDTTCDPSNFSPTCYDDDTSCFGPIPPYNKRREIWIRVTYALCSAKAC